MISLSICIATFKRADVIGETLASILPQLTGAVEVVVLDGASPDNTADVVGQFAAANSNVRYMRAETNSGIDADFDRAVAEARGQHCWLFSDDDTLVPGAIAAVLAELGASDPDLLVVDAEVRDRDLDGVFEHRRLAFSGRRQYDEGDQDRMLADLGDGLSFIGCAIIRRDIWMARERPTYYGSLFIHVGVLFQAPLTRVVALGAPLIRIRIGNAMWTARGFQIWMFLWPDLIWSFAGFSDAAKAAVVPREPWRQLQKLLVWRAHGVFGAQEYRDHLRSRTVGVRALLTKIIAVLPGSAAHVLVVVLLALRGQATASSVYQLIEGSRFSHPISRWLAARFGYRYPVRSSSRD